MKLWTIQDEKGWNELQSKGVLRGKREFINPEFKHGYDWMREQMKTRLCRTYAHDEYPVWAWYQYNGSTRKRPDLRFSGHLPQGTNGYRIEIEKPYEEVLLSDFMLWHYPLSYKGYIGKNWKEERDFRKLEISHKVGRTHLFEDYPESLKKIIINSWTLIFDMDFDWYYHAFPFKEKMIQATFWELRIEEIINVSTFVAR